MANVIKALFRPLRITSPSLIDEIFVSDSEQIKRIEASGDVDRPHRYDTASLPWWVRFYFKATRFHDDERDLWFLALESASDPSYDKRHAYLREKGSTGYAQADVDRVVPLLRAQADQDVRARELAQGVNRRDIGEE